MAEHTPEMLRQSGRQQQYEDLIKGGYDCLDRIVLNAFFPVGHNPGEIAAIRFRVPGYRRCPAPPRVLTRDSVRPIRVP
jgi:hypothetical protein